MAREKIIGPGGPSDDDRKRDAALRPKLLREVIGQKKVAERLQIAVDASRKLKEPLGHILFDGPPGLGKTTFATVLPNELSTTIQMTSGPALSKPADMLPFLTNLEEGSILFIDEIHRMPRVVEEFIYPAMEDFRIDIVLGEGVNARTISMTLKRFTLIGATTRGGMLSGPMRDRFKMREHLDYYTIGELAQIVGINAKKLNTPVSDGACNEIARRSRGTPRVANSLLHWARIYSAARSDGTISEPLAHEALDVKEVDADGLDKNDRRYLEVLIDVFSGGPTGVEAIGATMNISTDTLTDEIEPYLLREQFLVRSPRGRMATPKAFALLQKPFPKPRPDEKGPSLFD
ncbi:Holliday junction branch migration DNA helicase RuvB [Fimbriiglobus ruber]|uniref:Holliday junction branch migration complex subunit RuvB n=1 Tax=Fimbriiglobus ruber TaxID=1908690 RepID=A0A225CYT8_9BACT|nr:Holliday junction branch migration DNA helicase RuvB [Fimbriiglobus ruber]OWK34511.1 Holliday junction DNA helicase RuvB [Fimbriiglobus ruber]